jgi:hypothetical protein
MDEQKKTGSGAVALFALLHLLCCGLPLLILSGVSLSFVARSWPVLGGILAVLGVVGFIWYLKRGCATCPRNEGRCQWKPKGRTDDLMHR